VSQSAPLSKGMEMGSEREQTKPSDLLDAIGELAMAIKPHFLDNNQREKIAKALHVLVDHIIAAKRRPPTHRKD